MSKFNILGSFTIANQITLDKEEGNVRDKNETQLLSNLIETFNPPVQPTTISYNTVKLHFIKLNAATIKLPIKVQGLLLREVW